VHPQVLHVQAQVSHYILSVVDRAIVGGLFVLGVPNVVILTSGIVNAYPEKRV